MDEMLGKVILLFVAAVCIFMIICNAKLYKKAGEKPIAVIVPIWNLVVMARIAFGKGAMMLICLIPIVGQIFFLVMQYKFLRRFSKSAAPAILSILLPPIGLFVYPMLAFSKDTPTDNDMPDMKSGASDGRVRCIECKQVIDGVQPGSHFICGYCMCEQDAQC